MRNVGLTLILISSGVLFIRGNTKCKLSENAEKKAVSQLNTCIDKGVHNYLVFKIQEWVSMAYNV